MVCSRLQMSLSSSSTDSEEGVCLSSTKACAEFGSSFKGLTRGVVAVAVGLSHNKEVKDFFVQLVEKLVEPLKAMRAANAVTRRDVDVFLTEYTR